MAEIPFPGRQVAPQVVETYKQPFSQAAGRKEEYLAGQAYQEAERIQRGFQIASGLFSLSGQTVEFVQGLRLASDAGAGARKEAQASLEVAQFLQNMAINPKGDPDWNLKVGEDFQEFQDELYGRLSEGFKTKEGQQNFEISFQKIANKAKLDVNEFAWKSTFDKIKMDYFTALDAAVETQNPERLQKILLDSYNHGVFKADEIQKLNDDYGKKYHLKTLDIVAGEARIKGPEAGIPWVNSPEARQKYPSLTSDEWKGIEKDLRTDLELLKKEADEQIKNSQKKADEAIFEDLAKTKKIKTTADLFNHPEYGNLGRERKEHYFETLEAMAKAAKEAREKKGKNPFEETNPEIEGRLYVMFDDPAIKDEEIEKYIDTWHGKGLSTDDAWKWDERKKTRTPDLTKKYAIQMIASAYADEIRQNAGDADYIGQLFTEQALIMKTYDAWYENNKEQPDEVKAKKAAELLAPFNISRIFGALERKRKIEALKKERIELEKELPVVPPTPPPVPPKVQVPKTQPAPKLEKNEVLIEDPKTGERFAYNRKTGKKRKL